MSALTKLADEDHTLTIERDPETHEMVLHGLGDQQINNVMNRLKNELNQWKKKLNPLNFNRK